MRALKRVEGAEPGRSLAEAEEAVARLAVVVAQGSGLGSSAAISERGTEVALAACGRSWSPGRPTSFWLEEEPISPCAGSICIWSNMLKGIA